MVRDELHELGFTDQEIDGGGLRITTTFTQQAMSAAEQAVAAQRPDGLKELHVAVASVDPKTGALRGHVRRPGLPRRASINWAVRAARPARRSSRSPSPPASTYGYSLKSTFDGNSPHRRSATPSSATRARARATSYGVGDQPAHGHRELGQHRLRRPRRRDGRRPAEGRRHRRGDGHPARRPGPRREPRHRARLGHDQPDRHGQRLRHHRRRRRGQGLVRRREGQRRRTATSSTSTR